MSGQNSMGNFQKLNDKYKKVMYIAFCCDEKYLIPASIMMESLVKHNSNIYIVVYSFQDDLSENAVKKIGKIIGDSGELRMCHLPQVAREIIDRAPSVGGYLISKAMYYRLLLPYVVEEEVEKILYLDCDILIRGNLWGVYKSELNGALVGGIRDYNAEEFENSREVSVYVNAGVLLMHIKNIKEKYSQQKLLEEINLLIQRKNLFGDQDIINILFENQIKLLPIVYNNHYLVQKRFALTEREIMKDTIVAHFSSNIKPWMKEYFFPYTNEYYSYLKRYIDTKKKVEYWLYKPIAVMNGIFCAVKRELK